VASLSRSGSVLVVNAGSTGLKLHLVDERESARRVGDLESVTPTDVGAVGHRIVHGGVRLQEPTVVDAEVESAIQEATVLAPLHNAPALAALEAARTALPGIPHVAVFDTAFHATLPEEAQTYALPAQWREEWGVRRYGFHGLSVQWAAEQVRARRLIVCHLGGGCSVTAVLDGRSVDTTMGFSPLEGVPMTTRSGSVDPGALVFLLREKGLTPTELDDALERRSGLAGLSGGSGHVHELLTAEAEGDDRARLALAVYVHRIAAAVGAMATSLDGLDALVFTAGVGERTPAIRQRICARLGFLGARIDPAANVAAEPDAEISTADSQVRIVVVATREELVVARAVRTIVSSTRS
jgi:acetate kinase